MIDIMISGCYPANELSNLADHPFVFDGVQCGGMEGLLQSLRFPDPEDQLKVAAMSGVLVKRLGARKNWRVKQELYWKGVPFSRHSDAYQALLDNAYYELAKQSKRFRTALVASGGEELTHSIGNVDSTKTLLTQEEFLSRLQSIRDAITGANND